MRALLVALSLLGLSATAQARCTGDCGGGGSTVSINELVLGVNIALGQGVPEQFRRIRRARSASLPLDLIRGVPCA
jgi:hypothetical protein